VHAAPNDPHAHMHAIARTKVTQCEINPANFSELVENAYANFRDHLIDELGEDTGLAHMPMLMGGIIGDLLQRLSEDGDRHQAVSAINLALERMAIPWRLRSIE
jgi:hypothetical protein